MKTRKLIPLGAAFLTILTLAPAQTANLTSVKDNTLYESTSGSLSNGAGTRMFVGVTDGNDLRRALVQFNIAASIPACATITSATLTMEMVRTNTGSQPVALHRATQDWGEASSTAPGGQGGGGPAATGDATWVHTFSNTSTWTTLGGDFVPTASASISVGGQGSYTWSSNAQLVSDVQSWVDNPTSNFGWLLKGDELTNPTAKAFATKEHSIPAERPTLMVTYTTGGMASTATTGVGCIGSSGVPYTFVANGAPSVGNASFSLGISGGPASGGAMIFVATGGGTPLSLGGSCNFLLDLTSALAFFNAGISPLTIPLDATGSALLPLPLGPDCSIVGSSLTGQVISIDTGGTISSNALTLNFGL